MAKQKQISFLLHSYPQPNNYENVFLNLLKGAEYPYGSRTDYTLIDKNGYSTSASIATGSVRFVLPDPRSVRPGLYRMKGKGAGTLTLRFFNIWGQSGQQSPVIETYVVPGTYGTVDGWEFTTSAGYAQNKPFAMLEWTTQNAPNYIRDLSFVYNDFVDQHDHQGKILDPLFRSRLLRTRGKGVLRIGVHYLIEHGGYMGQCDPADDVPRDHFTWTSWLPVDRWCGDTSPGPTRSHFQVAAPPGGWESRPGEAAFIRFPQGRAILWHCYEGTTGATTTVKIRRLRAGDPAGSTFLTGALPGRLFDIFPECVAVGQRVDFCDAHWPSTARNTAHWWYSAGSDPDWPPVGNSRDNYNLGGNVNPPGGYEILHSEINSDGTPGDEHWTLEVAFNTQGRNSGSCRIGCYPIHYLKIGDDIYREIRSHAGAVGIPYFTHIGSWGNDGDANGIFCNTRRDGPGDSYYTMAGATRLTGPGRQVFIEMCNEGNVNPGWTVNVGNLQNFDNPYTKGRFPTKDDEPRYIYELAKMFKERLRPNLMPTFDFPFDLNASTMHPQINRRWISNKLQWPQIGSSSAFAFNGGTMALGMSIVGQQIAEAYGVSKANVRRQKEAYGRELYRWIMPLSWPGSVSNLRQVHAPDFGVPFTATAAGNTWTTTPWASAGGDPAHQWVTHIEGSFRVNSLYFATNITGISGQSSLAVNLNNQYVANPSAGLPLMQSLILAANPQQWDSNKQYYGPDHYGDGRRDFVDTPSGVVYIAIADSIGEQPPNATYWTSIGTPSGTVEGARRALQITRDYLDAIGLSDIPFCGTRGGFGPENTALMDLPIALAASAIPEQGEVQRAFEAMWDSFPNDQMPHQAFGGIAQGMGGGGMGTEAIICTAFFVPNLFGVQSYPHPRWRAALEYIGEDPDAPDPVEQIVFPDNPAPGEPFERWNWDGSKWALGFNFKKLEAL